MKGIYAGGIIALFVVAVPIWYFESPGPKLPHLTLPAKTAQPKPEYQAPVLTASESQDVKDLLADSHAREGTLQSVSSSGTLRMTSWNPAGLTVNIPMSPQALINIDGTKSKVSALRAGMDVLYLQPPDNVPLARVDAFSLLDDGHVRQKDGPVDSVHAGNLVFLAGRRDLFPCNVIVPSGTTITVDGKAAQLTDVKRRMYVVVDYIGNIAQSIAAATWMNDGKPHHVVGNLYRINDKQVVIHAYGKDGFDVALTPAPDIKVIEGSSPGALADLHLNEYVTATYTRGIISDITVKTADMH